MQLTFLGAAGMVTGACYLLEAGGLRLLVDCGLFQGKEEGLNRKPFGFHPGSLDGVILTHAHIDHSGRLPLLRKQGFTGPIWAHPATADLAAIMLLDSAHIQETEAERANRKARRAGRNMAEPLYTQADAMAVAELFMPLPYGQLVKLNDSVQLRFQDAGHILGSCIAEVFETDAKGQTVKLVFSGDLGQPDRPILQDPTPIDGADYLVLESTYGNRLHEPMQSTRTQLADIIRSTIAKGGNVVIPSFAVGRTQEVLYQLNDLVEAGELPRNLKVVLDSPLAIKATELTKRHQEAYDEAAMARVRHGDDPLHFPGLVMSHTADDSRALNDAKEPLVIIAASGMCEAGRVLHHLKHNLWRPNSTILFVGYQAEGTLGRRILSGAAPVRVMGEEVAVRARVASLEGLSAHADQAQLLKWAGALKKPPLQTILVHGESEARDELAQKLMAEGHRVMLPVLGQSVSLPATGRVMSRKATAERPRVSLSPAEAVSGSARSMAALLRELKAVRKAWNTHGAHLPAGQAEELSRRASDLLRDLEEIRHLIEAAGE